MGDVEEMIGELEEEEDPDAEEATEETEEEEDAFGLDIDKAWSSPEDEG